MLDIANYSLRIANVLFLLIYVSFTLTNIVFLCKIRGRHAFRLPRRALSLCLSFSTAQIAYGIYQLIHNGPYDPSDHSFTLINLALLFITVITYFSTASYILFVWIGVIATQSFGLSREKAAKRRKICFISGILWLVLVIGVCIVVIAYYGFSGYQAWVSSRVLIAGVVTVPFGGSIAFIVFARRLYSLIVKLRTSTKRDHVGYKLTMIVVTFVIVLDLNVGFGILAMLQSFQAALSLGKVWPLLYLPEMAFNLAILCFFSPVHLSKGKPGEVSQSTQWDSTGSGSGSSPMGSGATDPSRSDVASRSESTRNFKIPPAPKPQPAVLMNVVVHSN